MRRLLIAILLNIAALAFAANTAMAADPVLVQSVSTSNTKGYFVNAYTVRLPNVTLSGNALVLAVQQDSGTGALSVSDDKGNSYNLAKKNDNGGSIVSVYYATNVVPGAQTITLTFAGGGARYVSAVAAEFYNVAPTSALDGTSANGATNVSVTAGNLATTSDNDLVFQYATQDGDGVRTSFTQGSSPWAMLAADYFDAQAAQYQIQAVHGVINPAFTQSASKQFNSVAIALKGAAGGTAPSGIRVVHLAHNHVPQAPPGTFTLQTPATGNLIVVSWIGAPGCRIGSVSDGNGNSYTSTGPAFSNGGSGESQLYFAGSATTSTSMSGPTLSVSGCDGASHNALVYDVSGAAASPYDSVAGRATASGNQTSSGNLTTVTISPSTANGLVITQTGVNSHTMVSVTPGYVLSSEVTPDIATGQVDNNNGWAMHYNPSAGPETFVYGTKSGQADTWASIAVAFKASGSAPPPPPPPPPPSFDFSISNAGNKTAVQGQSATNTITATLVSGSAQAVSFAASGLPANTTAAFSPASCIPSCSATLTLATSVSTPTGSSTITVTGTAGSLSRTTTFTLTVSAASPPPPPPPPSDTTPPTVSITTPGSGVTVSGNSVTVTATASDNVGVGGVVFRLDGSNLATEDTSSPYSITWNTMAVSNGSHTLTAIGRDAAGNQATSTPISVMVNNTGGGGTPPPPADPSMPFSIAAQGGLSWTLTNSSDSIGIGHVEVQPNSGTSSLTGLAIFGFRSGGVLVTEAGVPAYAPVSSGRIFVDVNGPVNTGIAFANPTAQDALITFHFTDTAGVDFGAGDFTLNAHTQTAAFLNQKPFNGRASMQGTFTFNSAVPVGVIALRGFTNERGEFLITTLPVSSTTGAATSAMVLPHFADGGGWTTQVVLANPSDSPITDMVQFVGPGVIGQSAPVLTMSLNGTNSTSGVYTIPAHGTIRLVTGNAGAAVQSGSIRITPVSGAAPDAMAIFSFKNKGVTVTEAGVAAMPAGTGFRMYAEVSSPAQTGSIQSGLAMANPSTDAVSVTLTLVSLDGSSPVAPVTITVPAGGQRARFIQELFPALVSSFQGVIKAVATAPIAMTGLRGQYNERGDFLITSTPPTNDAVSNQGQFVFPHIVSGGGYSTQVILFGQSASGKLWFNSQNGSPLSTDVFTPTPYAFPAAQPGPIPRF